VKRLSGRLVISSCLAAVLVNAALGRDLATLMPPETLAAVGMKKVLDPQGHDLILLGSVIRSMAAMEGIDPEELVMLDEVIKAAPLILSSDVLVALQDLGGSDSAMPQMLLMVDAGEDANKLRQLAERLVQTSDPDTRRTLMIDGSEVTFVSVGSSQPEVAFGARDGVFFAASSETVARGLIERMSKSRGASLAAHDQFVFCRKKVSSKLDGGYLWAYLNMKALVAAVLPMAGESSEEVKRVIDAMGLAAVDSAYLQIDEFDALPHARFFMRVSGERRGILKLWDQKPLTDADLKQLPGDVYWGQVWNLDIAETCAEVRKTLEAISPDAVAGYDGAMGMSRQMLGFTIDQDLLSSLGDTWALYDARSHGGLLFTGMVLTAELKDATKLRDCFDRVVELTMQGMRGGAVNVLKGVQKHAAGRIDYLVFGGLPIPFAPAWTISDKRMVVGLTPQSIAAVLDYESAQPPRPSLLESERYEAIRRKLPQEAISIGYVDMRFWTGLSHRFEALFDIAMLSMAATPSSPPRLDLIPTLAQALEKASDAVSVSKLDNDGVWYEQYGSGGTLSAYIGGGALVGAVLMPSIVEARSAAKEVVVMANLRSLGAGIHMYAAEHKDALPKSLDELVDAGVMLGSAMTSPLLEGDERAIVYVGGSSIGKLNPQDVLAYHKRVPGSEEMLVLFLDGHVERMRIELFQQRLMDTYKRQNREAEMPAEFRP
jgi:hypothetical protein